MILETLNYPGNKNMFKVSKNTHKKVLTYFKNTIKNTRVMPSEAGHEVFVNFEETEHLFPVLLC